MQLGALPFSATHVPGLHVYAMPPTEGQISGAQDGVALAGGPEQKEHHLRWPNRHVIRICVILGCCFFVEMQLEGQWGLF